MSKRLCSQSLEVDAQKLSFAQICGQCGVSADLLKEMLDYGVLNPSMMTISDHEAFFEAESLQRVLKAIRLCRDLDVNIAGAALAIDLLDEIQTLRNQLISGWGR